MKLSTEVPFRQPTGFAQIWAKLADLRADSDEGAAAMEILELKFAGIPLYTWLLVFGVSWFVYRFYVISRIEFSDWQERRARKKEYEVMKPLQDEQDRLHQKLAEEMRDVIQHELVELRSVDNSLDRLPGLADRASMRIVEHQSDQGTIMAKRKKGSKVQKRGKLRRGNSAKRGKARKVAKTAKRAVASAKPKRAPVKKAARKVKQPAAPLVETVAVEVIAQPAPGETTVTEVEETEVRKAS